MAEAAKTRRKPGLQRASQEASDRRRQAAHEEQIRHTEVLDRLRRIGTDGTLTIDEKPERKAGPTRLGQSLIRAHLPTGHGNIEIRVDEKTQCLEALAEALTGELVVLGDYSAIARIDCGYIEALVMSMQVPGDAGRTFPFIEAGGLKPVLAHASDGAWSMELSPASSLFTALDSRMYNPFPYLYSHVGTEFITLKISGKKLDSIQHAQHVLKTVADAWAFDLDAAGQPGFRLAERPAWPLQLFDDDNDDGTTRKSAQEVKPAPRLPDRSYEAQALAFYWYARCMPGAPFVQYLAYYQVIEFHFTRCNQATEMAAVAARLNSPDFDPHSGTFIASLINVFASMPPSKAEAIQLRTTLETITKAADLKTFILKDKQLRAHLATVADSPRVVVRRDTDPSILPALVAQHVYAVRNRVVHGKEGGKDGTQLLLLPSDPHFELMKKELPLMRFLATEAIRYSSTAWAARPCQPDS